MSTTGAAIPDLSIANQDMSALNTLIDQLSLNFSTVTGVMNGAKTSLGEMASGFNTARDGIFGVNDILNALSAGMETLAGNLTGVTPEMTLLGSTLFDMSTGLTSITASFESMGIYLSGLSEVNPFANMSDSLMTGDEIITHLNESLSNTGTFLELSAKGSDAFSAAVTGMSDLLSSSVSESIGNMNNGLTGILENSGMSEEATNLLKGALDGASESLKACSSELLEQGSAFLKSKAEAVAHTLALKAQDAAQKLLNSSLVQSVIQWAAETAGKIASKLATVAQTVAQGALNLVLNANPIALIVLAITALVAGFVLLWNKCEGFRNFMIDFFKIIANGFISFVNLIIKGINMFLNIILTPINLLIKALNIIPGVNIPALSVEIPTIPNFASGGFPSMGQMFIAREAGPELVGTIGSRSAVVNNDQIVESVSAGVYRAVRDAMAGQNGGPLQLIMDGTKVAEVVSRNVNAITQRSGRCPILV